MITISNEAWLCGNAELVEELEPQNVQIICNESDKAKFLEENKVVSETIDKVCDGMDKYFIHSAPVCELK